NPAVREFQHRPPLEHGDPFVFVLVVPEARRARRGARDDADDFDGGVFEEVEELLARGRRWKREEVFRPGIHRTVIPRPPGSRPSQAATAEGSGSGSKTIATACADR